MTKANGLVSWTYAFAPKTCAARPALVAEAGLMFEPFMQRGIEAIGAHIDGRPE